MTSAVTINVKASDGDLEKDGDNDNNYDDYSRALDRSSSIPYGPTITNHLSIDENLLNIIFLLIVITKFEKSDSIV